MVKHCPLCGAENSRLAPFCTACGDADLSTVPVEPVRGGVPATPPEPATAPAHLGGGSETCRVEVDPVACADTCVIELLEDPQVRFTVRPGQTVGRTNKADIVLTGVPNLEWISGAHARFSKRGDQWYAQHIGQTNFIRVDGETYEGKEEVAIYDNSVLLLSLSAFRVRLPG